MAGAIDQGGLAVTLATFALGETIRPAAFDVTLPSSASIPGDAGLQPLGSRFAVGATIGQGGMAVVRVATQAALHREVAVKVMREDATAEANPHLLREALITGALEHPNIVPVHDLGADERGRPMLVLKRIEGRPWSELIGERALEWNLQQLVQVCHAIAFAHSKGILHRDLKPSNIMVGGFGEVYVLDWGIAVSLVDDGSGRLPLASSCTEVAGTLAYMAPEMLGTGSLSERTDIYLLGAILFEIATGKPPHMCATVSDAIDSIRGEPSIPDRVPHELAAICRRALAKSPAGRFASADDLRTAIQDFLEHRGSAEIAREAHGQLRELEAHLARKGDETTSGSRVRIHQVFGQARFGFQAALRAWPGNEGARTGLDRALATMARYELDQGEPHMASVLIADLSRPDPDLAQRLAAVERAVNEKAQRLARVEADQDAVHGSFGRTMFIVLFGLAWAMMPVASLLLPSVRFSHENGIIATTAMIAIAVAISIRARRTLMRTALNRAIVLTVLAGLALHDIVELAAWRLGVDMVTTHMLAIGQWAAVTAICSIFVDRVMLVPTIGFFVALVMTIETPEKRLWAMSASLAVLLTVFVYMWKMQRRGRRIAGFVETLRPDD